MGWPEGVPFQSPSVLTMPSLVLLEAAVKSGNCYFVEIGKMIGGNEVMRRERKIRKDRLSCRGRQRNPAKPRKKGKTGKHILTGEELTEEQIRIYG